MTEKISKNVRTYFSIALAVLSIIVCALFIWQTLDIYLTKTSSPYSVERVAVRFARISPAFWLWIAMIVAGAVIFEVFPAKTKKAVWTDPRYILARYKKKLPKEISGEGKASLDAINKADKILGILWIVFAVYCLVGIVYSIVYLAIPSHFTGSNVNSEVLAMVKNVLPWVFTAFCFACGIAIYEGRIAKILLPEAKKIALNKPQAKECSGVCGKVQEIVHHKYFLLAVRIAIFVVAVAFIIAGILNGNMAKILVKAINICLECVGIG
jgi:hypothetical protein